MAENLSYARIDVADAPRPPHPRPLVELLTLALPTVAQMASYTVMQFTDTYMLSRVGDLHATAAGQSGMLAFSVISFGMGVLFVVNALVSQNFGRGDLAACGSYLWQGVWFSLGFGLLVLPLLPLAGPTFAALGHTGDLAKFEADYLRISLTFAAVKLAATGVGQFLLAVQRPNVVLAAAVCGCAVNVGANWVLIYGHFGFPALGVAGAAWGTNLAILVELLVLAAFAGTPSVARRFNVSDWRPRWDRMRALLAVGVPSGVQIVAEVLAWTLFTVWVINRYDEPTRAANNYAFRFWSVSFMPAFGIAQAVTALVGRYIGMGRPDVSMRRAHLGFAVTAAYMLCCGVGLYLGRRWLMGLFTDDPRVLAAGEVLLVFAAVYQFFDAMYIIYNGALRGAGDTFVPGVVTAALCWSFIVGVAWLVAKYFPALGIAGPWGAATAYGIILGVFLMTRFSLGRWKSIRIDGGAAAADAGHATGGRSNVAGASVTLSALQPTTDP